MGSGLPAVELGRPATAVAAGADHTCALLDDGSVKCWGKGSFGRLGLGDVANRGNAQGEMGNALPAVDLGNGRTAQLIAAGGQHTCALLVGGAVKCWGHADFGALGLGNDQNRGDDSGEMGDALPEVDLGTDQSATALSAGAAHTCARLATGRVKCWGSNTSGALGIGGTGTVGDQAGEMGDALPTVDVGPLRTVATLTTGNDHTCARLDDHTLKCWGANDSGQLGLGDTDNRGDAFGGADMGANLPVVDLGAGDTVTPSSGTVAGTVTDSASGAPVAGAFVAVLDGGDYSVRGGAVTDASGDFSQDLAPGSYYLYVIDPSGAHSGGFAGPPTPFVVTSASAVALDPELAPTRGSITGAVTTAGSGDPVIGAWAISMAAATGAPEVGAIADAAGHFEIDGLAPGGHLIVYVDPSGAHGSRFYPDAPAPGGASVVTAVAGASTSADVALPPAVPSPGGSTISGTVTDPTTGDPLEGVYVASLHAATYGFAISTVTDAAGHYSVDVAPGDYKLEFFDPTGAHRMEWHANLPFTGIASAATVSAPAVVDAALEPTTGSVSGAVVADVSAMPLEGAWVIAIDASGAIRGGAVTAADGGYRIDGLAPGAYRLTFADPGEGRVQEYWDDATTFAGASVVAVTAGGVVTDVNAGLALAE